MHTDHASGARRSPFSAASIVALVDEAKWLEDNSMTMDAMPIWRVLWMQAYY